MLTHLLACLLPQNESDVAVHRRINADIVTSLAKMKLVPKQKCELNIKNVFIFQFANHLPFEASINEEEVLRKIYNEESLYKVAGQVAMTAFDIAMSTGGSEAIVESFYSVMDTQRQVRQHHVTLESRSILDWATSNVLTMEDVIREAATWSREFEETIRKFLYGQPGPLGPTWRKRTIQVSCVFMNSKFIRIQSLTIIG